MRGILLGIFISIGLGAWSQTYFYINSVQVVPAAPTTSDNIEVHVIGALSSTASYIVDTEVSLEDDMVHITINAASSGIGLDILVPHTEVVPIGQLAAGTYTIHFMGANIMDGAPQPEHVFTVSATGGDPCNDIQIASVQYAAFSDSIVVHVINSSTETFGYPGFILFDANGDTVAVETVEFFGIAQESWHILRIHEDAEITDPFFTGTVELWTGFYDELVCTWPVEVALCPPAPCATIIPYVQNLGGALTIGTFTYSIVGDEGVVATGEIMLDDTIQYAADTLCIEAGEYTVSITSGATMGQPWFGVTTPGFMTGPQVPIQDQASMEFDFYEECTAITTVVPEQGISSDLLIRQDGDRLLVDRLDGKAIGAYTLFNSNGSLVASGSSLASGTIIRTDRLSSGIYILHYMDAGIPKNMKVALR
jgi:hypothetical protein